MRRFFSELRRRNVFRVAGAYAVVGWLLAQAGAVLEGALGLPSWFDSFIVAALLLGFPVALLLAWAFEMTPDGPVLATPAKGVSQPVSGNLPDYIIIAGLFLVGGLVFFGQIKNPPQRNNELVSIAVMPFIDLSENKNQEYFADGLSEELLNLLAKISDLRVASRTSAFAFKNTDAKIAEIADTLKVGHVLEGSVRMTGDRVRITAQLIDGGNGYHLWSETYDRTMGDIFAVQDDIAADVVKTLQLNMLGKAAPTAPIADPAAYGLYLKAKHIYRQFTPDAFAEAEKLYIEAGEIDPSYAPVWSELSSVYINQMNNGDLAQNEGCVKARNTALRALDSDAEHGGAYAKLAALAERCDHDLALAADYYKKALAHAPYDPGVVGDAAIFAESLGRLDTAIALKEYQITRQPVDAVAQNNLALAYYYAGRLDEAETAIGKTIAVSPDYIGAHYRLGVVLLKKGSAEAALAAFEKEPDEEYRVKGRALAQFSLGAGVEADAALTALIDGWGAQWPTEIAQAYAYRGEADKAFEWLEKRYEQDGPGGWGEQKLDPLFANLHDDPRWPAYLTKMNAADEQLAEIDFTVSPPG